MANTTKTGGFSFAVLHDSAALIQSEHTGPNWPTLYIEKTFKLTPLGVLFITLLLSLMIEK